MKVGEITEWQRRFRAQPKVWWITVRIGDVDETTGNFYDSKEAAELEFRFLSRLEQRHGRLHSTNVHSLQLSRERWEPAPAPSVLE